MLETGRYFRQLLLMFVTGAAFIAPADAQSSNETVLFTFGGANGSAPRTALVQGTDGNFYGASAQGNTIFSITPAGHFTPLHTLIDTEGSGPTGALAQGSDGNFYGTAITGGASEAGTVFKFTPQGMLTVLYTFTASADGGSPSGGLTLGSDGNFYGTTSTQGGANGCGTVFRITPAGILTTLYTFEGPADGCSPAYLIQGNDGNFYGTTTGGVLNVDTLFRITPTGNLTVLHVFKASNGDGVAPNGALLQYSDGSFYGTTSGGGGTADQGTVFKLAPDGTFTTLHVFSGSDGAMPVAGLVLAPDGGLYGTTENGGSGTNASSNCMGCFGTEFRITPSGSFGTVYNFTSAPDGANPEAALALGNDGSLYGTTAEGGDSSNDGTIYRITLSSSSSSSSSSGSSSSSSSTTSAPGHGGGGATGPSVLIALGIALLLRLVERTLPTNTVVRRPRHLRP